MASVLIGVVTVALSVVTSAFVSGRAWGKVSARIRALEATSAAYATKSDMMHLGEQLAEIKGMFQLVPKGKRRGL